ncbi:hypothetical protein GPALN_006111 [Globodera pallida]|nr:hypothetical protein GPALN_006111 [Globodera pallida]
MAMAYYGLLPANNIIVAGMRRLRHTAYQMPDKGSALPCYGRPWREVKAEGGAHSTGWLFQSRLVAQAETTATTAVESGEWGDSPGKGAGRAMAQDEGCGGVPHGWRRTGERGGGERNNGGDEKERKQTKRRRATGPSRTNPRPHDNPLPPKFVAKAGELIKNINDLFIKSKREKGDG